MDKEQRDKKEINLLHTCSTSMVAPLRYGRRPEKVLRKGRSWKFFCCWLSFAVFGRESAAAAYWRDWKDGLVDKRRTNFSQSTRPSIAMIFLTVGCFLIMFNCLPRTTGSLDALLMTPLQHQTPSILRQALPCSRRFSTPCF